MHELKLKMCDKCPQMITVFEQRTIPLAFERILDLFDKKSSENHSSAHSIENEEKTKFSRQEWENCGIRYEIEITVRQDKIIVVFATPPGYRARICGMYGAPYSNPRTDLELSARPTWIQEKSLGRSALARTLKPISAATQSTPVTLISAFSEAVEHSSRNIIFRLTIPSKMGSQPLIGSMDARFERANGETKTFFECNFDSEILGSEKLIEFADRLIDSIFRFSFK